MPLTVAKVVSELEQVYCPFTGKAVHGDDGVSPLASLLFVYFGNIGDYAYVSERLVALLKVRGINCDVDDLTLKPNEIAQELDCDNAYILKIDTGWNGINAYGFIVPS